MVTRPNSSTPGTAVGLPIMDRMYKEYAPGEAPPQMVVLAENIRLADTFAFVCRQVQLGVQPGLKNLTDHLRSASGGPRLSQAATSVIGLRGDVARSDQLGSSGGWGAWLRTPTRFECARNSLVATHVTQFRISEGFM